MEVKNPGRSEYIKNWQSELLLKGRHQKNKNLGSGM